MLLPMSAVGLRVVMYFSLLWRCCGTLSSLYGRGHCLHKDDDSYNVRSTVFVMTFKRIKGIQENLRSTIDLGRRIRIQIKKSIGFTLDCVIDSETL